MLSKIKDWLWYRQWGKAIVNKECFMCKKWGTMQCPNSALCYSDSRKPQFEAKEREK